MKLYAIIAMEAFAYTISIILIGLGVIMTWPGLGVAFVGAMFHDTVWCPLNGKRERMQGLRK